MRVVITGGAGFIGSHLCEAFVADGHEVVCVDDLSTGQSENIEHLQDTEGFSFIHFDVSVALDVTGEVDAVLHFASPASPRDFERLAIAILRVNSLGTLNALELARKHKACFLLASTSEVYGQPEVHPQPETYLGQVDSLSVRGPYDEAKRFSEAATMAYHRQFGLDTRIARIFNTYGTRMRIDDGRALPNFITQALLGDPLTIHGTGGQTRSFMYISDLVDGIFALLKADVHEPVNLGSQDEMPLIRLAKEILELTGSSSPLTFQPMPPGDPMRRRPDLTRARTRLKWSPTVTRFEGLQRTIDDFRLRLEAS